MRIATVLEKIDEHQLFVPAFQRAYVWKRGDAKQLVDFLIKQYPTGTMLTSETAKALTRELVPRDPADEPANKLVERIRAERNANAN